MNRNSFLSLLFVTVLFLSPVLVQAVPPRAPDPYSPDTSSQYEDIRDIIGPVELDQSRTYLFYALAALLTIAALTLLTVFILKRRKPRPIPLPDPADTALERLARAEAALAETGTVSFAHEVSAILRHYIEQSFKLPSTTQTTSEFFQSVAAGMGSNGQNVLSSHSQSLEQCLSLCDLAKYASFLPAKDAAERLSTEAQAFINGTRAQKGGQ